MEDEIIIIEDEEEQEIVIPEEEIEYMFPITQEKTIIPSIQRQTVEPDVPYTGLSKVTIEAVKLQNKIVSPALVEQTLKADAAYLGLGEVKVNPISSEYVKPIGTLDITVNGNYNVKQYEKANINIELPKITDASYLFDSNARVDYISELVSMISPECTNFIRAFNNIKVAPPYFDTSYGNEFSSCFSNNSYLSTLPSYDFNNAINCSSMFNTCLNLSVVPLLDLGKCTNVSNMFSRDRSLKTLGGFKDLGKAYLTTRSANYGDYKLDLSASTVITHDSLMNVINNLYDIASAGVQPQQLVIGSTNLAKITEEEIAIAQTKGWTVS